MMDALIERLGEQNKFVRWYRQYACKANGMPIEPDAAPSVIVDHQHTHTHAGQRPTTANPTDAAAPPQSRIGLSPWVKTAVVAGLSALGGGGALAGAGALLNWWSGGDKVVQPSEPAGGSLLQDLEDRGFHLPSDE